MPLLVLARHAFTPSAPASGTTDFERPLDATGLAQARRMGAFLAAFAAGEGRPLDTVIASAAVRTMQTACAAAEGLGMDAEAVRPDRALYNATAAEWEEAIATIPARASGALVVGHQPALMDIVAARSGVWPLPGLRPSTVAVFRLDSWEQEPPYGEPAVLRDFV